MPVYSFIKHFRHEFVYYVEHGRSMVGDRDTTVGTTESAAAIG